MKLCKNKIINRLTKLLNKINGKKFQKIYRIKKRYEINEQKKYLKIVQK